MKFSLINVIRERNSLVDGTWIQDCTGTLTEAAQLARDTERVNSNRITVAVIEQYTCGGPYYSMVTNKRRLDV